MTRNKKSPKRFYATLKNQSDEMLGKLLTSFYLYSRIQGLILQDAEHSCCRLALWHLIVLKHKNSSMYMS